jgi:aspartokinase
MREIDQRFNILTEAASQTDDPRSARHTDHSLLQLLRQGVYQVAAGYEGRNECRLRLAGRPGTPVSFG